MVASFNDLGNSQVEIDKFMKLVKNSILLEAQSFKYRKQTPSESNESNLENEFKTANTSK